MCDINLVSKMFWQRCFLFTGRFDWLSCGLPGKLFLLGKYNILVTSNVCNMEVVRRTFVEWSSLVVLRFPEHYRRQEVFIKLPTGEPEANVS